MTAQASRWVSFILTTPSGISRVKDALQEHAHSAPLEFGRVYPDANPLVSPHFRISGFTRASFQKRSRAPSRRDYVAEVVQTDRGLVRRRIHTSAIFISHNDKPLAS